MFRRSEESEWASFNPARSKAEKLADGSADVATSIGQADRLDQPVGNANITTVVPETNLTLTRTPPITATPPVYSEEVESTIGPTTVIDGKYRCESGVRIHGTAQGEIESAQVVFIEENAKVTAKVTAASIIVAGEVEGELHCTGRVEIRPSGRVSGTINAGTLVMQEGAYFDGNLKMQPRSGEPRPAGSAPRSSS